MAQSVSRADSRRNGKVQWTY